MEECSGFPQEEIDAMFEKAATLTEKDNTLRRQGTSQRERIAANPEMASFGWKSFTPRKTLSEKIKQKVVQFIQQGKTQNETARLCCVSQPSVVKIMATYRKTLQEP